MRLQLENPLKARIAKSPPKIGFIITEEQQQKLSELLPYGMKQRIFQALTSDLILILEKHADKRAQILGMLIENQLRFSEISPFLQKVQ